MGAVGSCFDNAVAETFFATLTKELLLHQAPNAWPTRAGLRSAIFEFIEGYYNPTRLHSTLGMRSPVEYEADHAADGHARSGTSAGARENLCTTSGCAQPRRQQQPDSTKPGEVQAGSRAVPLSLDFGQQASPCLKITSRSGACDAERAADRDRQG